MPFEHSRFYDFLFDNVPRWEEQIYESFTPVKKSLHPEPVDVRLLPNRLRRVYAAHGDDDRARAKRLRMSLRKFRTLHEEAEELLKVRLRQWLRRLPKDQRIIERKKRWHDGSWIGQVSTEPFEPSKGWISIRDWPNVGEPCDPTPKG